MTTGDRIRNRRKELGLSVDELAEKLNKNRATVYRYESNEIEKLPTTVLEPLAEALNVTPGYLMGWDYLLGRTDECVDEAKKRGDKVLFDNRLKQLREERGLNMRQTAQKLEIPYTTYVGYEKNEREPNSEMLLKLADFFNCSTDYLLGHTDDPVPTAEDNSPKRLKAAVRRLHPKKPGPKKKKQAPLRRSRKAILERLKSYRPGKPEVRKEEKNMKEDMSKYIHDLGFALMSYSRNGVYRIRYICENDSEYAEISFTDGTKKRVNITGDSCLAAMLDITKALI